jgi:hypothetical protein
MKVKLPSALKGLKKLLDGSLFKGVSFVKELPYIFLLIAMAFVYISNQYQAEKYALEMNFLTNEIRDLREKSISFASELMFLSKPSEITRLVKDKGIGLEEAHKPPIKIVTDNNKK